MGRADGPATPASSGAGAGRVQRVQRLEFLLLYFAPVRVGRCVEGTMCGQPSRACPWGPPRGWRAGVGPFA